MTATRVRWAFLGIDILFRAAWVIWVPTFFVYLTGICNQNLSTATMVLVGMYAFMFMLEVTLGSIADVLPGATTFYWSCICNGVSYALYAALPLLGWNAGGAILCELIGGLGMTLFSGAFERWYQSTLELTGERESVSKMFARLRLARYATSAVVGLLGIYLYMKCLQRDLFVADAPIGDRIVTALLLPHTWGAVLVFLALLLAMSLRRTLTNPEMLLAGGLSDPGTSIRIQWHRAQRAVKDGWRILLQLSPLRGGIYLACAHQLALTIVSFYWPIVILGDLGDWAEADRAWWGQWERLMMFWLAREAIRAFGAWINLYADRVPLLRASRLAVFALALAGLGFIVAGLSAIYIPFFAKLVIGVLVSGLLGVCEPHIDALVQGQAPPDLRSVMGSYKAMISSGFCAVGLIPIGIVALWNAEGGERYSFDDAVTMAGALVVSIVLFSWKHFEGLSASESFAVGARR
jgi:hypothetical protein